MSHGQRLPTDIIEFNSLINDYYSSANRPNGEMRSLRGSFGRLRIPLEVTYADRRGDLLEICVRLQNLCTHLVGINQIRSMYMPIWKADEQ